MRAENVPEGLREAVNVACSKWWGDVEGTDTLADALLAPDGPLGALLAEVERLRRWKSEAMPVMDGLQELGRALNIDLGQRITGWQALERVNDLKSELVEAHKVIRGGKSAVEWHQDHCAAARATALITADRDRLRAALTEAEGKLGAVAAWCDKYDADLVRFGIGEPGGASLADDIRRILDGGAS